jgi:hypothetical protein
MRFMAEHEDRWLFVVLYVGAAVTLSILLSLFWLIVLLLVHALFEWVHETTKGPATWTAFKRTLWAVKLDAGLVLFALALSLYMEVLLGVLGLRAVAQVTADDAAQVVRAATKTRKGAPKPKAEGAFGWEDRISIGLGVICLALIGAAPFLLDVPVLEVVARIGNELHPFQQPAE